jgi:hypothetical protein
MYVYCVILLYPCDKERLLDISSVWTWYEKVHYENNLSYWPNYLASLSRHNVIINLSQKFISHFFWNDFKWKQHKATIWRILSTCTIQAECGQYRRTKYNWLLFLSPQINKVALILWIRWPFSERKFNMTTSRNCFNLDFICGICVQILSLVFVPKNWHGGIFFIKGIFTNISMEMHSIFPDIFLTTTSPSTFLKQRLVVRRRRSAPPLATSRSHV